MNDRGIIYAEYKGQTYRLLTTKALLRMDGSKKDVWADVNSVTILESEQEENGNGNGAEGKADIEDADIATILSGLNREAKVYREVIVKPTALKADKKHAREQLARINSLKAKLEELT